MRRPLLLGSLSLALFVAVACGTESTLPDNGGASGTRSTSKTGKGGSNNGAGNDGGGGDESGAGGDEGNEGGSTSKGGSGGTTGKGGSAGKGGSSTLSCESGKGDCNVDKSDGCETDLTTSKSHCGSCGNACESAAGGETACEDGKCVTACIAFTGDCDGNPANGCETDTSSDLAHCGSCTAAPCKDGPHGAAACDGGKCALACEKGWGDCDGNAANGCELDLTADPDHCGSCTTSCEGKPCTNSACECAASATTAETLPLDIFLMLDKSSSMDVAVGGGSSDTKWKLVIQALNGFINGVTAADQMGMGFGLFPSSSCDISAFNKATVAVADLPGNAAALTSKLNSTKPNGGDTPTKPALEGAIDFAKKRLVQFPQRKIAVVLATDGEPNECFEGFPTFPPKDVVTEITAVAKAGYDAGVPTYAIGVFADGSSGSAKSAVEKWAKAGGTNKGFIVSVDPQLAENLKKSLDEIRKTAIGCEYKVPQPAGGKALDPQKVNVVHTPSGGGAPNTLGYVPDLASCKPNSWYYDNPTKPAKILLCPQACEVIKPDQAGKVEISVGCATRIENLGVLTQGGTGARRRHRPSVCARLALLPLALFAWAACGSSTDTTPSSPQGAGSAGAAGTNATGGTGGTAGSGTSAGASGTSATAGASGTSAGAAGATACPAKVDPPTVVDTCKADAECVLVTPLVGCCGPVAYATPAAAAEAWNAAATGYNACSCPLPTPCFQDGTRAEDDTVPDGVPAVARCLQGKCVASYVPSCAPPPVPASRACEAASDCAAAVIDTTCCQRTAVGLSASELTTFLKKHAQHVTACRGPCLTGCFPPPPAADDGSVAKSDDQVPSVSCVDKVCVSSFGP